MVQLNLFLQLKTLVRQWVDMFLFLPCPFIIPWFSIRPHWQIDLKTETEWLSLWAWLCTVVISYSYMDSKHDISVTIKTYIDQASELKFKGSHFAMPFRKPWQRHWGYNIVLCVETQIFCFINVKFYFFPRREYGIFSPFSNFPEKPYFLIRQ